MRIQQLLVPYHRGVDCVRRACSRLAFVPSHQSPPPAEQVDALRRHLATAPRLAVITGAGISTESGVPDYRSAGVGLYERRGHRPVQHAEFVRCAATRRRYWARNFAGWPAFSRVRPNAAHLCLAAAQRSGRVLALVTQNVDCLHQAAGCQHVVELHGSAHHVVCLRCDFRVSRAQFQHSLAACNKHVGVEALEVRPDGDVQLDERVVDQFVVPSCPQCGDNVPGAFLKPDIVFFGDSVPGDRVRHVRRCVDECDSLFVVGSSLHVYSAYRFVLHAAERGKPVLIVNIGSTRGDHLATCHVSARAGEVLPMLGLDKEV